MLPFTSIYSQYYFQQPFHHGIHLCVHWKMNVACIFLRNLLNLPVTEGHFVIVNKNSIDVLWLQEDATKLKCYESEIPSCPFSYIVGQIANVNAESMIGMTRVEFFLPLKEFLPQNVNSRMSINSGPCASIKEMIKTPYIGCMKNSDIMDLAFVSHRFFLRRPHTLLLQEWTMCLSAATCTKMQIESMMTYLHLHHLSFWTFLMTLSLNACGTG